jgi:hypothetical protein
MGVRLLGSPPIVTQLRLVLNLGQGLMIAPGRMYAGAVGEFEASAQFRGMTGAVTRPRAWLITTKRAFDSHSRNQSLPGRPPRARPTSSWSGGSEKGTVGVRPSARQRSSNFASVPERQSGHAVNVLAFGSSVVRVHPGAPKLRFSTLEHDLVGLCSLDDPR